MRSTRPIPIPRNVVELLEGIPGAGAAPRRADVAPPGSSEAPAEPQLLAAPDEVGPELAANGRLIDATCARAGG